MQFNDSIAQARMNEAAARDNWEQAFNKRVKKTQDGQFTAQLQAPEEEEKKDKKQAKAHDPEQKDQFTPTKPEPEVGYKPV